MSLTISEQEMGFKAVNRPSATPVKSTGNQQSHKTSTPNSRHLDHINVDCLRQSPMVVVPQNNGSGNKSSRRSKVAQPLYSKLNNNSVLAAANAIPLPNRRPTNVKALASSSDNRPQIQSRVHRKQPVRGVKILPSIEGQPKDWMSPAFGPVVHDADFVPEDHDQSQSVSSESDSLGTDSDIPNTTTVKDSRSLPLREQTVKQESVKQESSCQKDRPLSTDLAHRPKPRTSVPVGSYPTATADEGELEELPPSWSPYFKMKQYEREQQKAAESASAARKVWKESQNQIADHAEAQSSRSKDYTEPLQDADNEGLFVSDVASPVPSFPRNLKMDASSASDIGSNSRSANACLAQHARPQLENDTHDAQIGHPLTMRTPLGNSAPLPGPPSWSATSGFLTSMINQRRRQALNSSGTPSQNGNPRLTNLHRREIIQPSPSASTESASQHESIRTVDPSITNKRKKQSRNDEDRWRLQSSIAPPEFYGSSPSPSKNELHRKPSEGNASVKHSQAEKEARRLGKTHDLKVNRDTEHQNSQGHFHQGRKRKKQPEHGEPSSSSSSSRKKPIYDNTNGDSGKQIASSFPDRPKQPQLDCSSPLEKPSAPLSNGGLGVENSQRQHKRRRYQSVPVIRTDRDEPVSDGAMEALVVRPSVRCQALQETSANINLESRLVQGLGQVFQQQFGPRLNQMLEIVSSIDENVKKCVGKMNQPAIHAHQPVLQAPTQDRAAPREQQAPRHEGANVDARPDPQPQRAPKPKFSAAWKQAHPQISDAVPHNERKSDAELIEVGKIINGYQRHCAAPYAFSYPRGLLLRTSYGYLLTFRGLDGESGWTAQQMKRCLGG